ncbi:hypothetical protein IMZ08_18385 [Bacillus luteolus]|uniref:Uncharacterized protein n=1 Tax=Litchfieldia luteola TaxID=682179 RepID=A0ABR9QNC4_9BACI|nr:hypothetical protein [Cytobacillus luteolus]MBE4910009.1 hypothetical protein [Cytobacillus luteolus]MBP1942431.1 hypothetical protein [Cytobacillus luteolus]
MDHERDYDRDYSKDDTYTDTELKEVLESSYEVENELMRGYILAAERIHDDEELKLRLRNFAEGNSKRTKQLQDEIEKMQ